MQTAINIFRILWKGVIVFSAAIFAVFLFVYFKDNYTPKNTAPLTTIKNQTVDASRNKDEEQKAIFESEPSEFEKTRAYGELDCKNFQDNELAGKMLDLINKDRKDNDLKAYSWNEKLCESAKLKVGDMIKNSYFEHVSPTFVTPWHWMDISGYKYSFSGENLAMNAMTAETGHTGLMNSPGHRANIMNKDFTEIGIAYGSGKIDGKDAFFIVQHFGTPASAMKNEVRTICTDKKKAENNIDAMEKQKENIDTYLASADKILDKLKKTKQDTEEIEKYIEDLNDKKEELDKYIKMNEEYLAKCDN